MGGGAPLPIPSISFAMPPGKRPTNRGSLQGQPIQETTGRAPPPVKSRTSNVQADDVRFWRKPDIGPTREE